MNKQVILAMKPGRELDALVAEKVMGWKTNLLKTDWWEEVNENTHIYKGSVRDFKPSSNISHAWQVVEKMHEWGGCEIGCIGTGDKRWYMVHTYTNSKMYQKGITVTKHAAPEAICKAALLAVNNPDLLERST